MDTDMKLHREQRGFCIVNTDFERSTVTVVWCSRAFQVVWSLRHLKFVAYYHVKTGNTDLINYLYFMMLFSFWSNHELVLSERVYREVRRPGYW